MISPARSGRVLLTCAWLPLGAALFHAAGCNTVDPVEAEANRERELSARKMRQLASFGGTDMVEEFMMRTTQPYLEVLRGRGVPDGALMDFERVYRDFYTRVVEEAIVPVYSKAFSQEELDAIIVFLASDPGQEFRRQALGESNVATIVAKSSQALRPAIRDFLSSPTGRKFVSTSRPLAEESRTAVQTLYLRKRPELERQIQMIAERNKLTRRE